MDKSKIVDLTQNIIQGKEPFPYEVEIDDVTKIIPNVKHHPDDWYVVSNLTYCTHIGAHIEAPFHHKQDGQDLAQMDYRKLINPLVVIDATKKKDKEEITLADCKKYDAKIKKDSIVFIWTGADKLFHTPQWEDQKPYLAPEAAQYLADKGIACIGCDSPDIEVPGLLTQPVHQIVFDKEIPMVESCCNLEAVAEGDYICFILPTPFEGVDSIPCRIIAIPVSEMKW